MVKETIQQLIEKNNENYNNKNIVAFLGKVSSGKTVVAALLKYTLSRSWIPRTHGRWEAVSKSGQDEINEIIREMKKGRFPAPTPKAQYPKLIVGIYNMEGVSTEYELILHDMSGENYTDYLTSSEYENIEERLSDILSKDGAYLPYAKKYVIMIDCGEKDDWDTDIAKVGPMISTIREIKQKIHNFDKNEKIHTPISILFTKSDRLSEKDNAKTAKELADDYPELNSSLRINHDKKDLEFFKVSISTVMETPNEADKRVAQRNEEIRKEYEKKKKEWNKQVKSAIEDVRAKTKKQAEEEGYDEKEIHKRMNDSEQKTEEQYRQQFIQKNPIPENEESTPKYRTNIPLVYAESEYSKFISWILDKKNGS